MSAAVPELLAPAGSAAGLAAALHAGADAVYFGVGNFNMRHKAKNFALGELANVVSLCREHGARAYLALNTIIYERELKALETVVEAARAAGVDAVIGWDAAVIQAVLSRGMELHLSTQASVSNSKAIAACYRQYGIRRFVMARECSLNDLTLIRRNLATELGTEADSIEFEIFIHGAMCVSLSGRCFLSQSVSGHSANRGICLQPCRREYRIIDTEGEYEFTIGKDYVLSPKDLCTMPFFDKVMLSNVASLKIEGRARGPEYVSTVTSAYRRAIDAWRERPQSTETDPAEFPAAYEELKTRLTAKLRTVFNRDFHAGFYMGKPAADWVGKPGSQARYRKESVGKVVNYFRKPQAAEVIIQNRGIQRGDTLLFQGITTGSLEVQANQIRVNDKPAEQALRGESASIHTGAPVRRGDLVYRAVENYHDG
ncbi:MAG: hypothetical protein B0D92_06275 [Spirochaeta sp. LUC14_002_19_P3]|nr:MAG: hypothetical protein B0D92_06275 [Spirochaeta sp. LUC14_002_19_P3]